jgi:GrpB-like predicted nucleotidyltransferase (UPF0157 family)
VDDEVRLVLVDGAWRERYRGVATELRALIGGGRPLSRLHHVGSTAVPGAWAKPTLDLMAPADRWPLAAETVAALGALGYVDHGEHGLPGRRFFARGGHEVHLHVVDPASDHLERHLALRDLLRSDPVARERYARCKRRLVEEHAGDRTAYAAGKDALVRELEARALSRRPDRSAQAPRR